MSTISISQGAGANIATTQLADNSHVQSVQIGYIVGSTFYPAQVVTASGALKVDGSGATQPVTGSVTATNATASNLNAQVVGSVAHGSADSGNPIKQGFKARLTNPTAVSDGQRVDAIGDKLGRQAVVLNQVRDLTADNTITLTATAETTLMAAAGAGVFHDLTQLVIANTSVTNVTVDIRDTTAGTVRLSLRVPANTTMPPILFTNPKGQTTANSNWTAQLGAAVNDVRIYAQFVKNV